MSKQELFTEIERKKVAIAFAEKACLYFQLLALLSELKALEAMV